jgi:hypothetical protein
MGEMCCVKDIGFMCAMLVVFDSIEHWKLEKRQGIHCGYVIILDVNSSYE